MTRVRRLASLAALALLFGCAGGSALEDMKASFLGKTRQDIVSCAGAPRVAQQQGDSGLYLAYRSAKPGGDADAAWCDWYVLLRDNEVVASGVSASPALSPHDYEAVCPRAIARCLS